MIPFVPHLFHDGGNLDVVSLNRDLRALASYVEDQRGQRYTDSALRFELDGITDASAQVLREFAVRLPAAANSASVERVELRIFATASVDWSVACSDSAFPGLSVSGEGSTVEAFGSIDVPIPVASDSSDLTFTLSAPSASTITAGELVIHLRSDRGNQGDAFTAPAPPTFDALTSTAQATIQAAIDGLLDAADDSAAADQDLRVECFAVRSLGAGASAVVNLPSGVRQILHARLYVVGAAGASVTLTIAQPALSVGPLAGGGATVRTTSSGSASGSTADDPTDPTDDTTVTLANGGGATADLAYALVWWQ